MPRDKGCDSVEASASDETSGSAHMVSVVIPCYRSEKTIGKVVQLTREVLEQRGNTYEFILVNDGSPDDTFASICKLAEHDSHIMGINLARNFGQHNAIMAGLAHVSGDVVMLMDDDMQTHPSQCHLLLDELDRGGWDVVFAHFPEHQEASWRLLGSAFASWSMRVLTGQARGIDMSNFFVMQRFVCDEISTYMGPYVYIQGLIWRTTHHMTSIDVQHFAREEGASGYTMRSLIRLWSTVLNFSLVPLRCASLIGAIFGLLGLISSIVLVIRRLLDPTMQMGWASLMAVLLLCSGFIMLFLGALGEYVGRLFMTANKAPQYVVRTVVSAQSSAHASSHEVCPEKGSDDE